ncbi:MAG: hypothetical protein BWK80_46250, partial [Desulfobacteraceae bacterium IS3]
MKKKKVFSENFVFNTAFLIPVIFVFFTFNAGYAAISVTPNPADNATGVALDSVITATFSEKMDPSTIMEGTFLVTIYAAGIGDIPVSGEVTYDEAAKKATFKPRNLLDADTQYFVKMTTLVGDLAGNFLETDYEWEFNTQIGDTYKPLISVSPAKNAVKICAAIITATFSEEMDGSSIQADHTAFDEMFVDPSKNTFYLSTPKEGGEFGSLEYIPGKAAYSNKVATFTPNEPLKPDTKYSASITSGVKDIAGNYLPSGYKWSFTAGTCGSPITVVSVVPPKKALDVSVNSTVSVTFSQELQASTITAPGAFTLLTLLENVEGTVTYSNKTAVFKPSAPLNYDSSYTVKISSSMIQSLSGSRLQTDYVWSFFTESEPPPAVVPPTQPPADATDVAIKATIRATFTEEMWEPAITASGTFKVNDGSEDIEGRVSYKDKTATFTLAEPLRYGTRYTATITTDAQDPDGNHLEADYVWSFTTTTPPRAVPPTQPPADAKNVSVSLPVITAVFSKEMKETSLLTPGVFTVNDGSTDIAGTVSYSNKTAAFKPAKSLEPDTLYTAAIKKNACDLAGNALEADYVWKFTTGSTCSGVKKGDINNDGDTDILDLVLAIQICAGNIPF